MITGFTVPPAMGSEREALWETFFPLEGLVMGNQGYLSSWLKAELASYGIELSTPIRDNMKDERSKAQVYLLPRLRRLIETVNGQLSERSLNRELFQLDLETQAIAYDSSSKRLTK